MKSQHVKTWFSSITDLKSPSKKTSWGCDIFVKEMAKLAAAASPRRGLRWVLFFLYLVTWHFVQKATLGIWMYT